MTWVKICGITNLEDALVAVDAGADAVGFVFHEKSPRKVDVETVRAIVAELPARVEKVGVFVEQSAEQIREIVGKAGLSAVQLHGKAIISLVLGAGGSTRDAVAVDKMILAVPAEKLSGDAPFISGEAKKKTFALLLDSGSNEVLGGTGKRFDWLESRSAVQGLSFLTPVIVAGGLTPANVKECLQIFQPFGVDVASGVEARPGKKDSEKVRAFVRTVREAKTA